METFNVGELKNRFSNILQRIKAGEEIIISFGKTGKKIAVLVPYDKYISNAPRPLGLILFYLCVLSDRCGEYNFPFNLFIRAKNTEDKNTSSKSSHPNPTTSPLKPPGRLIIKSINLLSSCLIHKRQCAHYIKQFLYKASTSLHSSELQG